MKRYLPLVFVLFGLVWYSGSFQKPTVPPGKPDLTDFGQIPVLAGGRIKPMDTIARNTLMIIHGKQSVKTAAGRSIPASRWLADTLFNAELADTYPAFVINHPDVLGLFGWQQTDRKYFSFNELTPFFDQIQEQAQQADEVQAKTRSTYQKAIINLRNSLVLYNQLANTIQPEDARQFAKELDGYKDVLASGQAIAHAGKDADKKQLEQAATFFKRFDLQARMAHFLAVPPVAGDNSKQAEWISNGQALLQSLRTGSYDPIVLSYAKLGDFYRAQDTVGFQQEAADLRRAAAERDPHAKVAGYEYSFNQIDPFYRSMVLYVLATLLAFGSWMGWSRELARSAFWVLVLALAMHSFGLISRMYLQERPPVTNLYSSAVFIGWGTVVIALLIERIYRDGIGAACAGAIGFITLIIAHHLAGSGDTMEMLQAVLDTNIWLATHVVVITIGYSAMFLAGMLAVIYIVRGVFSTSLSTKTAKSLAHTIYGVICFATLFSFVGTVLGGIWADQSWGRFWGWDPKENGALLIVLWCALILHARWGRFIGDRGLAIMAVFGNVVTAFSWFGVNMLGVGLHSYGFMEKAFPWLVAFIISQLVLMAVAAMPVERWRSFASQPLS